MADATSIETYRSLRATIKHAAGVDRLQSVLVVDVDRKAPSSVARNLALAFAAAGERCVLIDADFRNAGAGQGLADYVRDPEIDFGNAPGDDGVTVVGPGESGGPDLLSNPAFGSALASIAERFDQAIITCGAYPEAGDAVAIAPNVDAVILVISAGVTGREPAIRARDALERVGANILGLVMVERPRRWF